MLALALVGAVEASPPPDWVARVSADSVVVDGDLVEAEGGVELHLLGQRCEAASLSLDRPAQTILLRDGSCADAQGRVAFESARIEVDGGAGVLLQARYAAHAGDLLVTGARLERIDADTLQGEDAWISLCRCDAPPWSVEARQVTVEVDDVARFRGGWIRVCGARVAPVPLGGVALADRRTGLLVPRLGWGRDGVVVSQPVMVTLGRSADLVVAPEWRRRRGWRGIGEARLGLQGDEGATASGFAGWDTRRDEARGAVRLVEGWTPGPVRTAVEGQWVSDDRVLVDYGDDFLSRAAPWSEQRALLGVGPLRLETDRYQAFGDQPIGSRPASLVAVERARLGPLAVGTRLQADTFGRSADGWSAGADHQRLVGALGVQGGLPLGPARVTAWAGGRGSQWDDRSARILGQASATGLLDLWGDVGPLRHLASVGGMASVGHAQGPARARLPDERAPPAWRAGPVLHSAWAAPSGIPVQARFASPWTPAGWRPRADAVAGVGVWQVTGQATRRLQDTRVVRDDGVSRFGVGAAHTGALVQGAAEAAWRLPGPLSELRPGWRGLADLRAGRVLSQGVSLGYQSRCDCLSASAGAVWSADRRVPDLLFTLDLR